MLLTSVPATTTFSICVYTGVAVNDGCFGAIELPVNSSCNPTVGYWESASQSIPPITCNDSTAAVAGDLWYKFTATATNAMISAYSTRPCPADDARRATVAPEFAARVRRQMIHRPVIRPRDCGEPRNPM